MWQPIETAPKDGTKIDLWFAGLGRMTDSFWRDGSWWHGGDEADEQEWCFQTTGYAEATHWMPRPAPPRSLEDELIENGERFLDAMAGEP